MTAAGIDSAKPLAAALAAWILLVSSLAARAQSVDAPGVPESVHRLEQLMERLTEAPLYRGNAVRLLLDGPETHSAMLDAIRSAERQVHFETYIFAADEIGELFAQAFVDAAERGAVVRVIYDAVGSRVAPPEFFARLEAGGVAVHEFNPVDPVENPDPRDKDTRDHRKLLVVDGRIAFTGGINIDRNYARPSQLGSAPGSPTGWRDTHLEVRGPAVAGFEKLFLDMWQALDGPLAEPPHAPDLQRAGAALVRVLAGVGGDNQVSTVRLAFQAAAEAAGERIWITQSYFVPDDVLVEAITAASARGVDVRIIVAGFSDSALVVNASRSFYTRLLERGVRIYESQEQIMHAKTMVVDGAWTTIGSSNFDYLSFLHNHEANAVIVEAAFGRHMEEVFRADLENAIEIELDEWERRSLWQRTKELYSRWMRYRL